ADRPWPGRAHGARLRAGEWAAGPGAPPGAPAPGAGLPRRRRRLVRPRIPPPRHGLRRQADHLGERRGPARELALPPPLAALLPGAARPRRPPVDARPALGARAGLAEGGPAAAPRGRVGGGGLRLLLARAAQARRLSPAAPTGARARDRLVARGGGRGGATG